MAKHLPPPRETSLGRALARGSPCEHLFHTLTVLALGALGGGAALADEPAAPGPVNLSMCRGCHGVPDYRSAYPEVYSVPKIGGQQAAYIAKALREYKSGTRAHATMRGIAATLSDADIAALAAYYSDAAK